MGTEDVHLAASIKHSCRNWFDHNRKEDKAELVPNLWLFVLYAELTQVEMYLFMRAAVNPADLQAKAQRESQDRSKRIAAIEEIIKKYPVLEQQIRPDLDRLWKVYR